MKRRSHWPLWLSLFVLFLCVGGCFALVILFAQSDTETTDHKDEVVRADGTPGSSAAISMSAAGPKRMPVAGAEGFFIVINPDGSSYMESPDG